MSNIKKLMMSAAGGGSLDVDEVFSTYLFYSSNNISPVTVTNNIDLAGEGGMVWVKSRTDAGANPTQNNISDTERGTGNKLITNGTYANIVNAYENCSAFNSDGFAYSDGFGDGTNKASWTFRKAPKFFDVVTYTGNGTSQTISHNLGSDIGFMVVKKTSGTGHWIAWHKDFADTAQGRLILNLTSSYNFATSYWNNTAPTSTGFTVGSNANTNESGATYVAYLWAHNDGDGEFGPDGDQDIIKCGSYTTDGSGQAVVDLGFEPQFLLTKKTNSTGDWTILDSMRGFPTFQLDNNKLYPNTSGAEVSGSSFGGSTYESGFRWYNDLSGQTYIYMAIRRGSLFPPESATDVFAIDYGGNASSTAPWFTSGFPVDLGIHTNKASANNRIVTSRLFQGKYLKANENHSESNISGAKFDFMDGFYNLSTSTSTDTIGWMWKRAPGFFDVVAWEGTSEFSTTINHNLGVIPEMMWIKNRNKQTAPSWAVYHKAIGTYYGPSGTTGGVLTLNTSSAVHDTGVNSTSWWRGVPDEDAFYLGASDETCQTGSSYIGYLFATLPGISKVGSYTGDGTSNSSKVIDCGFTSGARFVLIKAATGEANNWFVFDTERGIVAGFDARLILNLTNTEAVNADYIDPHNSGFIVGAASNTVNAVNVSGVTYIFYAVA